MANIDPELRREINALKEDLTALRGDLSDLGNTLLDKGQHAAAAMKDSVQDGVRTSVDTVAHKIEERPITTMLIAFAAGLVAGKVFGGR